MAEAFEDAATDMLPHVLDPNGPQWREACALGSSLMPDNALFDLTATDADDYPHDEQLASEQPDASLTPHQDAHEDEQDVRPGPEDEDIARDLADFDIDQTQRETPATRAWNDGMGIGKEAWREGGLQNGTN